MNTIIPDRSAQAGGMLGLSRRLFCPRSSLLSRWRCRETLPAPPSSVWRVVRVPTTTAMPHGRTYAKKGGRGLGCKAPYHVCWSCDMHITTRLLINLPPPPLPPAAKKRKGGGGGSLLTEEERDVLDLPRIEAAMQASITALKREYTHNLVTRLTPGVCIYNGVSFSSTENNISPCLFRLNKNNSPLYIYIYFSCTVCAAIYDALAWLNLV